MSDEELAKATKAYLSKIGSKGGSKTSRRKRSAVRANIVKARAALEAKRKKEKL